MIGRLAETFIEHSGHSARIALIRGRGSERSGVRAVGWNGTSCVPSGFTMLLAWRYCRGCDAA